MINFKRLSLIILTLLLSASLTMPSGAQEKAGNVQVDLTAEERAFLVGKQLRLGVDVARPPFEYLDGKGDYTGISAAFITAAAKRLGIAIVPMKEIKWSDAMEKVKVGEIDVIPKVTPSVARAKFMIFSKPYTTFPSVIVTRKDRLAGGMEDLRGLKVGVNKGQIIEANLKRDHPEFALVPYPDIETGLRAVSTGQCNVYVDNLGAVAYTIDTVGLTNLRIAASTPYTHDLAFGVRKDWPLLASALDKALASMTDQEKTEIKNRWLAIKYDAGINWRIFAPIGVAMLFIIAFVLIWNRRLRRVGRERERIQEELKENAKLLEFRSTIKAKLSRISVELQQAATFEELARTFLSQMAPLMGAAYGVFYLMDEEKQLLQAVGGYGWMETEAKSRQFKIGEGLPGQCAREKTPLSLNNSQDSNIRIVWGGGDLDLSAILLQPILEQDKILAVIELGALQPFTQEQREILGEIMPTLALNLMITRRNLTTQELLVKGQEQIAELDQARRTMLGIMEDLEMAKQETEARNAETQELLQQTQRQAEELKIQQEQIKEAEERSRAILNAISVGTMIIHPQTKIIRDVNPVAAGIIGLPREEIIGRICHKFVCPKEERQCPITDLGQTVDNSERVILNAAGKQIPVIKTVTSVMLGGEEFLLESFVDITERKEIEKKLIESSEQIRVLSNVVEQSPLSVMITDREGRIEYVNPKFKNLTGYDVTEIRGKNPRFLKSGKHDSHFYADLWKTILNGQEWHGKICNRRKNGELYWERASISSIHSQSGGITHFVSIREDFTEQMRMEAELKERMEELERFNKLTIKREEKMISLKEEINALLLQTGREAKYKIVE